MTPPPRVTIRLGLKVLLLGVFAVGSATADTAPADSHTRLAKEVAAAIESAIAAGPEPSVRLLRADLRDSRLELDFSGELAAIGPGSAAFEAFRRSSARSRSRVRSRT